jgi:hypothetical protein
MSKRARHAQTGRFVKRADVRPAWPELDVSLQEALAAHVFAGDVYSGGLQLRLHRPEDTQHAHVTVHRHVQLASRVCKAWKRAFDEWLPNGIAGASARVWALAIGQGLERCQYSGYVVHTVPGVPYLQLDSFLPFETTVQWKLFLHGKKLATLTLTRRLQDVVGDGEVVEGVEHVLNVSYQPVRAPRMQLATRPNAPMVGNHTIHIPDVCWTEAGATRGEASGEGQGSESAVEQWTREKKAFLERWVLEKGLAMERNSVTWATLRAPLKASRWARRSAKVTA